MVRQYDDKDRANDQAGDVYVSLLLILLRTLRVEVLDDPALQKRLQHAQHANLKAEESKVD